jgi:hypothetical protein
VLAGIVLATVLATLSYADVSFAHGITSPRWSYRHKETFQSQGTVLIGQAGFPSGSVAPSTSDSGRLPGLAVLYAHFVRGDVIKQMLRRSGPLDGQVGARALTDVTGVLPLIAISGYSHSRGEAYALAQRAIDALRRYIRQQQTKAEIPVKQRVVLLVVNRPTQAVLVTGRSKARPALVFVTILLATLALAFVLENLRPRRREIADFIEEPVRPAPDTETPPPTVAGRRTA